MSSIRMFHKQGQIGLCIVYIESFNGKMRVEVLNREVFDTLLEAKVLVERWRREYNHIRPHSALGYRPPAPEVIVPMEA